MFYCLGMATTLRLRLHQPKTARPAWGGKRAMVDGAARGLFVVAVVVCAVRWVTPGVALAMGAALALIAGNPFHAGSHRAAKWLLQGSIVLLGFSMDLGVLLQAGAGGAVMAAVTIAITLGAGFVLGRWLKIRPMTMALVSAGTAICGGSAIAAVGSALDSEEGDMTVAMGTIFLLNAAALYLFPILGHTLGLTQQQFGMWAGMAIHDVSSVVGAAGAYGAEALQTATAVKLSRALWIIPLTVGLTFAMRNPHAPGHDGVTNATFGFDAGRQKTGRRLQMPWFIALFVLASVARSIFPAVADVSVALMPVAKGGLTLTLFLIGASLTLPMLRAVGWKPLVHGGLLWATISVVSLAGVMVL